MRFLCLCLSDGCWHGRVQRLIWLGIKLGCFFCPPVLQAPCWGLHRGDARQFCASSILAGCHLQHTAEQTRAFSSCISQNTNFFLKNQVLAVCRSINHIIVKKASLRLCIVKFPLLLFFLITDELFGFQSVVCSSLSEGLFLLCDTQVT